MTHMKKVKEFFSHISLDCMAACLYFLCMPYTIVTTPFGSLLKVITFPVAGILLLKLFLGKTKPLQFNSVHLVYTIYIIISFCGLFMLRIDESVTFITDMMLSYVVIMLVTMRSYNKYEKELIDSTWIVVGIICIWLCLTSNNMINEFENRTVIYIFGFTEDPNQFCAYYIMPTMVAMKRIVQKRKTMPLYALMIILTLYAILKTGSRGGLLGVLIGVVSFIIFGTKSIKAKLGTMIVGVLTGVLVVTVVFPLLPADIQDRFTVENVASNGGSGRTEIWEYLIKYTGESPGRMLHGSGMLSTYPIMEANRSAGGAFVLGRMAHNQFIQVFTDQGLIGLLGFLALIFVCVFRNIKKEPYIMSAFVSVLSFSLSLTMYVFKPYLNIIMMCAMDFNDKDSEKNEMSDDKKSIQKIKTAI